MRPSFYRLIIAINGPRRAPHGMKLWPGPPQRLSDVKNGHKGSRSRQKTAATTDERYDGCGAAPHRAPLNPLIHRPT